MTSREGIYTPVATFASIEDALAATLPAGTLYRVLDTSGAVLYAGAADSGGSVNPLLTGQYIPFAELDSGNYGYTIDSGGTLITAGATGLTIAVTASTSWQITLTCPAPTTGAIFGIDRFMVWGTFSAPVSPALDDEVWVKSALDANNSSQAGFYYDGANWNVSTLRTIAGTPARGTNALLNAVNGERVLQLLFYPDASGTPAATRDFSAAQYFDTGNNLNSESTGAASAGNDSTDPADTQTLTLGGNCGAGASWTYTLHGIALVRSPILGAGVPF
jgi:hypothetical protein